MRRLLATGLVLCGMTGHVLAENIFFQKTGSWEVRRSLANGGCYARSPTGVSGSNELLVLRKKAGLIISVKGAKLNGVERKLYSGQLSINGSQFDVRVEGQPVNSDQGAFFLSYPSNQIEAAMRDGGEMSFSIKDIGDFGPFSLAGVGDVIPVTAECLNAPADAVGEVRLAEHAPSGGQILKTRRVSSSVYLAGAPADGVVSTPSAGANDAPRQNRFSLVRGGVRETVVGGETLHHSAEEAAPPVQMSSIIHVDPFDNVPSDATTLMGQPGQPGIPGLRQAILYEGGIETLDENAFRVTYVANDVKVNLGRKKDANGVSRVTVSLRRGDKEAGSFDVESKGPFSGSIGLLRFDNDSDKPQIFLTSYSGGAHCCTRVTVIDISAATPHVIPIGDYDGRTLKPEDYNNDGVYELVVPDERFRRYDLFVNTLPPVRVIQISGANHKDVTLLPDYMELQRRQFRIQAQSCAGSAIQHPGACAGLLGTAANLGVLEATASTIAFKPLPGAEAPADCKDADCKSLEKLWPAIANDLKVWGYGSGVSAQSPALIAFMGKLTGKSFGSETLGDKMKCSASPVAFAAPRGKLYSMSVRDDQCAFSNAKFIGQTMLATAVCKGKSDRIVLKNLMTSIDNDKLSLIQSDSSASLLSTEPEELNLCEAKS